WPDAIDCRRPPAHLRDRGAARHGTNSSLTEEAAMNQPRLLLFVALTCALSACTSAPRDPTPPLWRVYENALKGAKYVDLTHTMTPTIAVWAGFGPATFGPTVEPTTGAPYNYSKDGFEATRYVLASDQLDTQHDPTAHCNTDD